MDLIRIDENHIEFNGKVYVKDKRSGYYWNRKEPITSLHYAIFVYHGGIRPDGYELHHEDFDKENNDISNIKCITIEEHKRIHTEHRKLKYGKNWNIKNIKKAQKALKTWHQSKEYEIWKKDNKDNIKKWAKMSFNNRVKIKIKCQICGEIFEGYEKRKNKICSNKCNAAFRRLTGKDNVKKNCIICKKEFISNKFQKIETCSNHCRAVLAYSRRDKNKKNND